MNAQILLSVFALIVCTVSGRSIEDVDNAVSGDRQFSESSEWVKISHPPPKKVEHQYGTTIELECTAMGSPPPSIQWVRGTKPIDTVCPRRTPSCEFFV